MLREGADTWPDAVYDTDLNDIDKEQWLEMGWKKKPSIHMPRWASRITLEIVNIRVERLQEISEEEAIAEGLIMPVNESDMRWNPIQAFQYLWNRINATRGYGWNTNPWVWVIEFKGVRG